jgi:ribose/xylose/arabinose/galactoside ABC-type transport system permease subunit
MRALILQLGVLGIAMALPLYLADDLDVSIGPVALLGVIWAVSQSSGDVVGFGRLLPVVVAAGLAVGLLNGVLAVRSGLPTAAVTLATGTLIIGALSQTNVHLAVLTPLRLTLDGAAVVLALVAVAALSAFARRPRRPARAAGHGSAPPERVLAVSAALLVPVAALLFGSGLGYEPVGLAPVHGASLSAAVGFPLATALLVLVTTALLVDPARRPRTLWAGAALLLAMPLTGLAVLPDHIGRFLAGPLLGLPVLLVVAASVEAGAWPPAFARPTGSAPGRARVAALATSAALAATAGAMMGAQGVRDAGFLSQSAFVSLLPVIALLVGGQHVLPRGVARLAAAVGGALVTATLAVAATQPSDNLAPGLLPCLLAAIVAGPLWRLLLHRAGNRAPLADA